MQDIGMQYHIHCTEGDVGRYVFLPGDPGRCESIAAHFDNPVHIGMNREYNIYTGTLLGASGSPRSPVVQLADTTRLAQRSVGFRIRSEVLGVRL